MTWSGCPRPEPADNESFLRQFNAKVFARRVPVSGGLDLTEKCNLKCLHCYWGRAPKNRRKRRAELTLAQWLKIIDKITAAGCLYLFFTGGEPLLRKDFADIYLYAVRRGLLVTVFTNGTVIGPAIVKAWRDYPPQAVEVSVYGATAKTYEAVTGVAGSFSRCVAGIGQLARAGIRFRLKTVLMRLNHEELALMEAWAGRLGAPFHFDAAIFPRFNGDRAPLALRLDAEQVAELEFADEKRERSFREFYQKNRGVPRTRKLYDCGAGMNTFHIDSRGFLLPCIMVRHHRYDLLKGSFGRGWNGPVRDFRRQPTGKLNSCGQCEKKIICGACPAFFRLETGSENVISPFICQLGTSRLERILAKK